MKFKWFCPSAGDGWEAVAGVYTVFHSKEHVWTPINPRLITVDRRWGRWCHAQREAFGK